MSHVETRILCITKLMLNDEVICGYKDADIILGRNEN